LDQHVIEWAFSIPLSRKVAGRKTKPVLRALAKRYLPRSVVDLSPAGFECPLTQWLTGDLKEMRDDLILSQSGLMGDFFDRNALEWLLSPQGKRRLSAARG
jgi:asparagine synthase (glutamine-hydrolysing)